MARIPYADLNNPEAKPLVERIVAERGQVLHLYQMLLQSPPVASGWLNFLTAIRQKSSLPPALRELVIMRVAVINGAPYEAEQHAPIALREGVTQAQLDELIEKGNPVDLRQFFGEAPKLNEARSQIKGIICGVRIEEIEDPLMREIRYLDKLIDELAKGRPMEKILRA